MTGKLSEAGRAVPNSLYLGLPPLSKNFKYELLCTNLQHSTAWHHNTHIARYDSALCHSFSVLDMKFAWCKLAVTDKMILDKVQSQSVLL